MEETRKIKKERKKNKEKSSLLKKKQTRTKKRDWHEDYKGKERKGWKERKSEKSMRR